MALKNHSVIESTRGEIKMISDPRTRLMIIKGLAEVLSYERDQAIEEILITADPESSDPIENVLSQPPVFDN